MIQLVCTLGVRVHLTKMTVLRVSLMVDRETTAHEEWHGPHKFSLMDRHSPMKVPYLRI